MISAISNTRPPRELSRPDGKRTLTSPCTAIGSMAVPDAAKLRNASHALAPWLTARYAAEAAPDPAETSTAAPDSSQPNGRSGRRAIKNAPVIAYGTA